MLLLQHMHLLKMINPVSYNSAARMVVCVDSSQPLGTPALVGCWHFLRVFPPREAKQGSYSCATKAVITRNGMAVSVYFRERAYPLYCCVVHAKFAASEACLVCQE